MFLIVLVVGGAIVGAAAGAGLWAANRNEQRLRAAARSTEEQPARLNAPVSLSTTQPETKSASPIPSPPASPSTSGDTNQQPALSLHSVPPEESRTLPLGVPRPSSGQPYYWAIFMNRLSPLHNGFKTYQTFSPAGMGMCPFYVRMGTMTGTTDVHIAIYIPQLYCTNAVLATVAKNYSTILQDLKDAVQSDGLVIFDLSVKPLIFIYSDDTNKLPSITAVEARKQTNLPFFIETPLSGR